MSPIYWGGFVSAAGQAGGPARARRWPTYPVAYICPILPNVGPLPCPIEPKAHPYRGPFRAEHLPVTGVTDADTELIGECA